MNPDNVLSNVEKAILSVLSEPLTVKDGTIISKRDRKEEFLVNTSSLPPKKQSRYITSSMGGDEDGRLFSANINDLIVLPAASFGVILPTAAEVKELSFTKLKNIPPKYMSFSKSFDSVWQLDHYLTQVHNLKKDHMQRVFGIRDNKFYVLYPFNTNRSVSERDKIKHAKESSTIFSVCASIVEDYQVSPFWNIDITDGITISTYGQIDHVKQLLDIRNEPLTETGQRKRVLHWVAGHRRVRGDKVIDVPQHLRGLTEYEIGGFHIKVTQPTKE